MNSENKKIITRFPPSPTGGFHVGSARTALFNWLFTKKHGGVMYLRFEDTDKERSKREYEKDVIDALDWLGIDYYGPFRQSERTSLYKRHLQEMIKGGHAYVSEEKEGDRGSVIRFKNPNTQISFEDEIRGVIKFDTTELGDFVLAKSLDEPLYHLAVVVDDFDMGVTHIIRGDDHISNTPRQILIQDAIGAPRPIYAHIPLILGPDKSKLSKRHGAKSTLEYKEEGFISDAMVNYLALLGWSPGNNVEYIQRDELVELFTLDKIQKGGAVFNIDKFLWLNKEHLYRLPGKELKEMILDVMPTDIFKLPQYSEERFNKVFPLIRERMHTLQDVQKMSNEGELEYFFEKPGYHPESLNWKSEPNIKNTRSYIKQILDTLEGMPEEEFFVPKIKESIWDYAESHGKGNVLWPMRYALSGVDKSADPFTLAEVLGKTETLARLNEAILKIDEHEQ